MELPNNRIHRRPTRRKPQIINIPAWWLGMVAGIIVLYLLFNKINPGPEDRSKQLRVEAIQKAQQAVREKIGDSLSVAFSQKVDVQREGASQYTVRSTCFTTQRGEQHVRSWIVTLDYQLDKSKKAEEWKVLSCYIGQ